MNNIKKTILWLRSLAETLREAQYAPLILLAFVVMIWMLPSYQSPPQQPQTVTIALKVEEVEVVLKGLGKLPLEESGNIFFSIKNQAERQLSAPPDTTGKKKEEPKNKKQ